MRLELLKQCSVCTQRTFFFARRPGTPDRSTCRTCGSQQRHRLLWLYLERETPLLAAPLAVLHFAPEPGLEARLRRQPSLSYTTADLQPGADLQLDLQRLDLPTASVDVILCSHVLEHVPDDGAALRELHRVIRPGGWAILQVPIQGDQTDEDPDEEDPAERLRRFGQRDHVRTYGRDFEQRLSAAGFVPNVIDYRPALSARDRRRFGLRYNLTSTYGVDFDDIPEPWEIWHVMR